MTNPDNDLAAEAGHGQDQQEPPTGNPKEDEVKDDKEPPTSNTKEDEVKDDMEPPTGNPKEDEVKDDMEPPTGNTKEDEVKDDMEPPTGNPTGTATQADRDVGAPSFMFEEAVGWTRPPDGDGLDGIRDRLQEFWVKQEEGVYAMKMDKPKK